MKETIGLITVALCFIAYIPYILDILQRRIKPHPYSWFVWGTTATIMFFLQILHGGGAMSWSTLTVGIISFGICVLSWRSGGKRLITPNDRVSLAAALASIVLWLMVDQPTNAMLLLVCADIFGFIPTVRKTWRDPKSETLPMWGINALRHSLNLFAITSYTLLTVVDPIVWAILNFSFCIMVLSRRKYLIGAGLNG